jgi:hypothetical protein
VKRPFKDKRPIGPFSSMGERHQDIVVKTDGTFDEVPSSLEMMSATISNETALSVSEDDMEVLVNKQRGFTVIIHSGGPDITHEDIMQIEQIVGSQMNSNVLATIARAK